jgi:hypothetical protein
MRGPIPSLQQSVNHDTPEPKHYPRWYFLQICHDSTGLRKADGSSHASESFSIQLPGFSQNANAYGSRFMPAQGQRRRSGVALTVSSFQEPPTARAAPRDPSATLQVLIRRQRGQRVRDSLGRRSVALTAFLSCRIERLLRLSAGNVFFDRYVFPSLTRL